MNSWIIETLGWTLLHSLWQISFIAVALFCILRIFRDFSANLRYFVSVSALCLSFILPFVTFVYFSNVTKQVRPTNQNIPTIPKEVSTQETKKQIVPENIDVPPIVSADNSVSSSSPNVRFMPIMVGFWLIGVLFFSIRLMGGIWTVHLYKTREISEVEALWKEKFDELCEHLEIRQKIKFLQSKKVEMPMVIGWLKPVVLVPVSAFLQISPKELETILIHELTHIKRHDYLVNFLNSLVEILFFYHPCVWWISAKIRAEREFAVDEFISQTFETERIIYANALVTLEEIRTTLTTNLAMAANGGNLMKRIENILSGNRKINSKNISIWSAVFAVTLVLGITAGIYGLQASTKTKSRGKIAVVFSDFSNKKQEGSSYQDLFDLQKKYGVPATWILDSALIDNLKQNETADNFFHQAKEYRSDFIVNVPNISYTIFINGDDEYIELWKNRIQFVDETLARNGEKLTKYSINYKSQIPQEMENSLIKKGLKQVEVPYLLDFGYQFSFAYDKNCGNYQNIPASKLYLCREPTPEKQKELREKYLQYMNEVFEVTDVYSQEKFGEISPQILTLRSDGLTKDSAAELLQMLQDKGYEFVPLEEVTSNEIFKKLQEKSRENAAFQLRKSEIIYKYLQFPYSNKSDAIKKAEENLKKSFNVEVTTKDLKVKQN